ncbi:ABC transporter ATP-binding protein [Actinoplanes sp. ATCC 53533]|uniref:ABC transporter ATP-binding protein n=1 Tax=Actinoplanes sp. ATCC 53533 TaxID=1288362 RepID=UPI000F78AE78|nr:ABC transporter ATP-binding protein [Actinoplanes sp. ATCC 53533]RSM40843.1 ABC transporter ATP-binding protein [Actinoplanes sp. ATCC 53533]
MTRPLLEVDGLGKRFGSLVVTDDVSFTLDADAALGVVGPNGAGKSTMLNLLSGTVPADRGNVHFQGQDVTALPASERCRLGIGRTYQIPRPFVGMSVFENVLVAATAGAGLRSHAAHAAAVRALDRAGISRVANERAGNLLLLDRKRLELARALATGPRLVLLDEIGGGLTDAELKILVATVQQLRSEGIAVIWIEHIVHALLQVVDRLLCLTYGRVLVYGTPAEVMSSKAVQDVYLGTELDA